MFGEVLNQDDLLGELDALIAAEAAKELGDLEPAPVIVAAKTQPVAEEEEDEKVVEKPKR